MTFKMTVTDIGAEQEVDGVSIKVTRLSCAEGGFAKVHLPASSSVKVGDCFTLKAEKAEHHAAKHETHRK